jgi:hypothetical protein
MRRGCWAVNKLPCKTGALRHKHGVLSKPDARSAATQTQHAGAHLALWCASRTHPLCTNAHTVMTWSKGAKLRAAHMTVVGIMFTIMQKCKGYAVQARILLLI